MVARSVRCQPRPLNPQLAANFTPGTYDGLVNLVVRIGSLHQFGRVGGTKLQQIGDQKGIQRWVFAPLSFQHFMQDGDASGPHLRVPSRDLLQSMYGADPGINSVGPENKSVPFFSPSQC